MILPLLCASLIASAAVGPAVLPQYVDVNSFVSPVTENVVFVSDSDDTHVTDFPLASNNVIKFILPFGDYYGVDRETVFTVSDVEEISYVATTFHYWSGDSFDSFALDDVDTISISSVDYMQLTFVVGESVSLPPSGTYFNIDMLYSDDEIIVYFAPNLIFYDGALAVSGVHDDGNLLVAAPVPVDGVEVVGEIVSILGAGIGQLGSSIGQGIATFASSLAFDGNGNLSIYFIMVISLASVSLAIALTTRLFTWLTTLGN